jgi:hypothetical protein
MCQLAVEVLRQRLSAFLANKMAIEMEGRKTAIFAHAGSTLPYLSCELRDLDT